MSANVRYSRYNVWHLPRSDWLILYNTLSGGLVTFDNGCIPLICESLATNDPALLAEELAEAFLEDGFIVPDSMDELAVIRTRNLLGRTQNELILSIMLTLRCNFGCFYCFETRRDTRLEHDAESRIRAFLDNRIPKLERLSVDWYGGEPLMAVATMRRLNDAVAESCLRHHTDYVVSLTSNGYLLDDAAIEYLTGFNVSHLQITLDGPAETHDQSRPTRFGKPTFGQVSSNICRAVNAGIPVIVRVNVWKPNAHRIIELYDVLDQMGLRNHVNVILKPVISSAANPCDDKCFTSAESGGVILPIYREAAMRGWVALPFMSHMQGHEFCIVDSVGQFIIDPEGYLYKCGEVFSLEERVGFLTETGETEIDETQWTRWIAKDPFNDCECRQCQLLPICMGGCSMKQLWRNEKGCVEFKPNLPELLEVMALSALNEAE